MKVKKSIEDKMQDANPEFVEECKGLTSNELELRLAQSAKDLEAIETAKEDDGALTEAQINASNLAAPYREGKKAVKLRSRYLIKLLKDRG